MPPSTSNFAVIVNLGTGIATGQGTDTLVGIESARGSEFGDTLKGNGKTNYFYAGVGDDTMSGKRGDDFLYGEDGTDGADGGPGNDWCEAEAENCELP